MTELCEMKAFGSIRFTSRKISSDDAFWPSTTSTFYVVFAIPSGAVEYRYSAVCIFDDTVGYFVILLGEDKELDGLAGTVDNPVEHDTDDEQGDETEDYPAPVMEYKVTGADDEYITNHDHSSQRYVFVFIDNSRR